MLLLVAVRHVVDLASGGDGECADKILHTRGVRRDEVGQREIRLTGRLFLLLAEAVEDVERLAGLVEDLDVFAGAGGLPEAHDAARAEEFLGDDFVEESPRVVVKLACFCSDLGIIEECGKAPAQLPGMEEWRPVEIRDEFLERDIGWNHAEL